MPGCWKRVEVRAVVAQMLINKYTADVGGILLLSGRIPMWQQAVCWSVGCLQWLYTWCIKPLWMVFINIRCDQEKPKCIRSVHISVCVWWLISLWVCVCLYARCISVHDFCCCPAAPGALSWLELAAHLVIALNLFANKSNSDAVMCRERFPWKPFANAVLFLRSAAFYFILTKKKKWRNNCTESISSFPFINISLTFFLYVRDELLDTMPDNPGSIQIQQTHTHPWYQVESTEEYWRNWQKCLLNNFQ